MSADLLDGGRPKRLVLRQGRWFLEISRLVSTGDGVFQPRSTRVEGKAAIVEALRRSKHGQGLVDAAAKLVANGAGAEDVSFDAVDGKWVPSRLTPSYTKQLAPGDVRTPVEAALLADLTMLRASHEGLLARVARLERMLSRDVEAEPPAPRRARKAARAPEPEPEPIANHGFDPEPAEDAADAPPEAERVPERAPSAMLEFPALGLVTDALKQLCGNDVPLKEMRSAPSSWLESPRRFYASWLTDEEGVVQGGILYDGEAVARLGGAYLAMSQADIEANAASDNPAEDIVSATSDISVTLSGLLNDLRSNPRVLSSPLTPFAEAPPDWIESPGSRLVCVHPGGGTVAFVSR